jgi:hypothetical protein
MSTSDGEYEWNLQQDWKAFKAEVYAEWVKQGREANLLLAASHVQNEVGGDYGDVLAAIKEANLENAEE